MQQKVIHKLLTVVFIFALAGCGPASKVRRVQRLLADLAADGHNKVDTVTLVHYDTAKIRAFRDAFTVALPEPRPEIVVKPCADLVARPTQANVRRVQQAACPTVARDTTFRVPVKVNGVEYPLQIRVETEAGPARFYQVVSTGELVIPIKTETNRVSISAGHSNWVVIRWALLAFFVGAGVVTLLNRFRS